MMEEDPHLIPRHLMVSQMSADGTVQIVLDAHPPVIACQPPDQNICFVESISCGPKRIPCNTRSPPHLRGFQKKTPRTPDKPQDCRQAYARRLKPSSSVYRCRCCSRLCPCCCSRLPCRPLASSVTASNPNSPVSRRQWQEGQAAPWPMPAARSSPSQEAAVTPIAPLLLETTKCSYTRPPPQNSSPW